jgi:hypothetical protein
VATYAGLVRIVPGLRLTRDYINGFYTSGSISGTVKELLAPGVEAPLYCRVILLRDLDRVAVRSTMTNPATGAYTFSQIDNYLTYTVIAIHPTGAFGAVIADGVTPV